jgi:integrase
LREKGTKLADINFPTFDRSSFIGFLDWLETQRNCSALSRNQRLSVLKSFFKYAGIVDCSVMELSILLTSIPKKKTQGKVVEFLSEAALSALLKQPDVTKRNGKRDLFFLILMYDTAARCGEMISLRMCDLRINDTNPTVYLTGKGGKTRIVPLMPKTVEHCRAYLQQFHTEDRFLSSENVFYTISHGERHPLSADAIALFMTKYANAAMKECPEMPSHLHPHMLRHTRAMHLYRNSMPLSILSEFLGHASTETTTIYAYADAEMKRDVLKKSEELRKSNKISSEAVWVNDDEMILRLSGLK